MTITRIPLNGPWRLLPVDIFRHGFYPLDDNLWVEQELPAHWQQHPLFQHYAGKMVYRRAFEVDRIALAGSWGDKARFWLRLNGIFYWSQAYFNGVDLGRHEGYFFPQEHEVTRWVERDNLLVVEVECPDEHDKTGKRLITGVFSHWDGLDPETNPGGIWQPVELLATGPVRISEVLLDTAHIAAGQADLHYQVVLNAAQPAAVRLRWSFAPHNFAGEVQVIEQHQHLSAGENLFESMLPVRDPHLWWTHDLGHPNCYTVTLSVLVDGAPSDEYAFLFGIRRFELRNWIPHLNGVRFFVKGNNYAPGDTRIATMTYERYAHDLQLAQECHMNMLRVHAHVSGPEFYNAADRAGILLWQDFPLQWLYRRSVLPEARRQVRQMVRLLYNHPSIAIWCMHNEPLYIADTKDDSLIAMLRMYTSVFFWSWNREVMDTQLKQVAQAEDQRRPVVRSSGEYWAPLLRHGTDAHLYHGWYGLYGGLRGLDMIIRYFPGNIRFVTEFGAQSFPNYESCLKFMDPDIKKIDWEELRDRHHFQTNIMSYWINWRDAHRLEDLVQLTQEYQIAINRFYIDRLRFHKYRPTGGIIPFMFHDPNPAIQWSIIDYWRVPKASYYAMQTAFAPQYVFTLLSQDHHKLGESIDLPVYVVNDAHREVTAELTIQLFGPREHQLARVERQVTLPPDCAAFEADRLRLTPDQAGSYRLVLVLRTEGAGAIENDYAVIVDE